MEWTYTTYTIANYGITLALVLTTVIGVNPTKAYGDYAKADIKHLSSDTNPIQIFSQIKRRTVFYIGIFCCLLEGMTLSITAVLMFQGCFLTDIRITSGDDCLEYPMDCFVFQGNDFVPITRNATFLRERLKKAQFPSNIFDTNAWCVTMALIALFTIMLAVIIYLAKCRKTVALSVILISTSGMALGIFELGLFYILPKPKKQAISPIRILHMQNGQHHQQSYRFNLKL
ncbi:hypothetical protein I4U23_004621 [Adineta vaga]|nr:hypothetical protein I4U23_004621 [Adineta vaga]